MTLAELTGGTPAVGGAVLAVFAHPDDESLSCGGLLAALDGAGVRTVVVTATWASGTDRARELAEAVAHLGAEAPRLLGYADERVPESAPRSRRLVDAPGEEVAARLVTHLRDVRPEVVATHDRHGGLTGHPDHVRTHEATLRAIREAARADLHPDAGPAHRVDRVLLATHPHAARPLVEELVGARRAIHTVADEDTTRLDVTAWLPLKVAAVLSHRSEVERGALPGVVAALGSADRRRLLGQEWYQRLPGPGRP